MGGLANLVLRGRIFYFRRRVPADLRERLARRELVRSLGTMDPRAARSNACRLYLASEDLFTGLRAIPMLTDAELSRLVQDFYATVLQGDDAVRLVRAEPLPSHLVAAKRDFYGKVAARAREALASDGFGEAREIAASLLRRQGIATATFGVAEWNQVRQAVLKAGIDVAEAMQARCAGDFEHEPKDRRLKVALAALASEPAPSSTPAAPATATSSSSSEPVAAGAPTSKPLSELWPFFCEQQTVSGAWEGQTASQARATFRLFIDVCGDKATAAYTRRDASCFRQQVERLPALYGKSPCYRGKSVAEIIALYAADTGTTKGKPLTPAGPTAPIRSFRRLRLPASPTPRTSSTARAACCSALRWVTRSAPRWSSPRVIGCLTTPKCWAAAPLLSLRAIGPTIPLWHSPLRTVC